MANYKELRVLLSTPPSGLPFHEIRKASIPFYTLVSGNLKYDKLSATRGQMNKLEHIGLVSPCK